MFVFKGSDDAELFDQLFDESAEELYNMYFIVRNKFFPGFTKLSDAETKLVQDFTMEALYSARRAFKYHKPEYKEQDSLIDL